MELETPSESSRKVEENLLSCVEKSCLNLKFEIGEIWKASSDRTSEYTSGSRFDFVSYFQLPGYTDWSNQLICPSNDAERYQHHVICPYVCQAAAEGKKVVWANTESEDGLISGLNVSVRTVVGIPLKLKDSIEYVAVFLSGSNVEMEDFAITALSSPFDSVTKNAASSSLDCTNREVLKNSEDGKIMPSSSPEKLTIKQDPYELYDNENPVLNTPLSPVHLKQTPNFLNTLDFGSPTSFSSAQLFDFISPKTGGSSDHELDDVFQIPPLLNSPSSVILPTLIPFHSPWQTISQNTPVPGQNPTSLNNWPSNFLQLNTPAAAPGIVFEQGFGNGDSYVAEPSPMLDPHSLDGVIWFKVSNFFQDYLVLPDRINDLKARLRAVFDDFLKGIVFSDCFQAAEVWVEGASEEFTLSNSSHNNDQFLNWKTFNSTLKLPSCYLPQNSLQSMLPIYSCEIHQLLKDDPRRDMIKTHDIRSFVFVPIAFASAKRSFLILWSAKILNVSLESLMFMKKCLKILFSDDISKLDFPVFRLGYVAGSSPKNLEEWKKSTTNISKMASPMGSSQILRSTSFDDLMEFSRTFSPFSSLNMISTPPVPPNLPFNSTLPNLELLSVFQGPGPLWNFPGLDDKPFPLSFPQPFTSFPFPAISSHDSILQKRKLELEHDINAHSKKTLAAVAAANAAQMNSQMNSRTCQHPGCQKCAQGSTKFCISHGGGRRCTVPGCAKGARDKFFCAAHGGGKRCNFPQCTKAAVGGSFRCTSHGGGKRCKIPDCPRSAQSSTDFCVRHGGGRKCKHEGCTKVSRGKTSFCASHGGGSRCAVENCAKAAVSKQTHCRSHAPRMRTPNQLPPTALPNQIPYPFVFESCNGPLIFPSVPSNLGQLL